MPASLYHYLPVPMDEAWKEKDRSSLRLWLQGRRTWVLVILVILVILSMAVPLGHFAVQANSEACQHGLREEKQWRNTTQHLRDQLARAQEALLDADATCNSTVENLTASLSQMKTLQQKQQEQVQSLQSEITLLKQQLQEASETEKRLRNEINAIRQRNPQNAASSRAIFIGPASATLLLLVPAALCF
ncbi:bone marrow stromal antigen 2 isoform X2 [Octodon degus]|uniref:Bone marrow stromal antigen 2 isoform X2 n=1 Tax=Octodon degus TaxID=10160 RepID=A0A6P3FYC8_OCTDE|nr:bone marrow stromal antigen 2 isoform X2 [Octodon degus]